MCFVGVTFKSAVQRVVVVGASRAIRFGDEWISDHGGRRPMTVVVCVEEDS